MAKRLTIPETLAVACIVADGYKPATTEAEWKVNEELCYQFYVFLQGNVSTEAGLSVFPCAAADEWDPQGAKAGYIEGTLHPKLAETFPDAMKEQVSAMASYKNAASDLHLECHIAGYRDGDGSSCGSLTTTAKPVDSLCILSKRPERPCHFKALLVKCTDYSHGENTHHLVTRYYNSQTLCNAAFLAANNVCAVVKAPQFKTNVALAGSADLFSTSNDTLSPEVRFHRTLISQIMSKGNNSHSNGLPPRYFRGRLEGMRLSADMPLSLQQYAAGMLGADGCIGLGLQTVELAKSKVLFNVDQSEMLIFQVGSFDYDRRVQWLIFLMGRMIHHAPPFAGKSNVKLFLCDLIKVVREEEPSP
ncbi:hypothetical protein ACHAXT_004485 [Thalassiosira profunda]